MSGLFKCAFLVQSNEDVTQDIRHIQQGGERKPEERRGKRGKGRVWRDVESKCWYCARRVLLPLSQVSVPLVATLHMSAP
jgi:hypothetical protein